LQFAVIVSVAVCKRELPHLTKLLSFMGEKRGFFVNAACEMLMECRGEQKNLMHEHQIKNGGTKASRLTSTGRGIPIEFTGEAPQSVPIKIRSVYSMNEPSRISEESLLPALFQIAARFDGAKMPPGVRNILTLNHDTLPEQMLNQEKLEGILKAIARRKKTAKR
jgi:hypothetical protein